MDLVIPGPVVDNLPRWYYRTMGMGVILWAATVLVIGATNTDPKNTTLIFCSLVLPLLAAYAITFIALCCKKDENKDDANAEGGERRVEEEVHLLNRSRQTQGYDTV